MIDRGIIKWQPFESVISQTEIKKNIKNELYKINKPILANEQIENNEKNIIESLHGNINIKICYFKNNQLFTITKKVIKIIPENKKIIFNDYSYIFFDQIINADF